MLSMDLIVVQLDYHSFLDRALLGTKEQYEIDLTVFQWVTQSCCIFDLCAVRVLRFNLANDTNNRHKCSTLHTSELINTFYALRW